MEAVPCGRREFREGRLTTYTDSDLRAVKLLTWVLFGVGAILLLVAIGRTAAGGDSLLPWIGVVTTLSLGTALRLKVRDVVRNKGSEEPDPYEGVFE